MPRRPSSPPLALHRRRLLSPPPPSPAVAGLGLRPRKKNPQGAPPATAPAAHFEAQSDSRASSSSAAEKGERVPREGPMVRLRIRVSREAVEEVREVREEEGDDGDEEAEVREEEEDDGDDEEDEDEKEEKVVEEVVTTCLICGRHFHSRNSLYGHMRCHPDREWRGMTPPPVPDSGRPEGVPIAGPPTPPLKWSTTQKRGRKGTKPHDPASPIGGFCNDDPTMMDAVFNLLFMANGRYYSYKTPFNFQSRNDPRIEDVQLLSDDGQSSNPTDSTFEPDKMEICEDRDRSAETPETPVAGHGGSGGEDQSSIFDRKGKRKMKDMEILQEPRAPWGRKMKYGCSSCNKSFHTHQALGGHMASHKKEKQVLDGGGGGGEAEKPASVEEQLVLPTVSGVKKAAMAEHRCDKCGVAFPTGQALGGHKRKHWNGHESSIFSNEAQEISSEIRSRLRLGRSSAVAPSQKDSSEKGEGGELYRSWPAAARDENGKTAAPPGVIDFDLNEQPIEEGES